MILCKIEIEFEVPNKKIDAIRQILAKVDDFQELRCIVFEFVEVDQIMNYSHAYSKLKLHNYTTIRRYRHGKKIFDVETETLNGKVLHLSEIVGIKIKPLSQITDILLLADTDCKTRKEAYALIQSFYEKPIDFEKENFFIFYLRKISL